MPDPTTVHLGTGRTREQFLAFYREDQPDLENSFLSYPEDYKAGDLVAWIVPGDVPALLNIEEFADPASDDLVVDSAGWNLRGVAIAGIEQRLGCELPLPPATLDPAMSQLFLDAAMAEEVSPTPWYLIDTTSCAGSDQSEAQGIWGCGTCGQRFDHLPLFQARAALQVHRTHELLNGFTVLCANCHAMAHDPFTGGLIELTMAYRPSCPRCGKHTVMHLEYGMPPGPVPGTEFMGCVMPSEIADFVNRRCITCENTWYDEEMADSPD
jgi:ribosomal protein L37AE/L43A